MKNPRRQFLKKAATGYLAIGVSTLPGSALFANKKKVAGRPEDLFKVGMAGYTFRKFKIEATLDMMERVNAHYLCIKDFHLPIDSTVEQIAEFHRKLKAKSVIGYGVGPIYMASETEIDNSFDYAKRVGVPLIVGVPEHELLPYVEKKVKEYNFRFAIHNHGLGDKRYPTVESVYERVKNLDDRIGMCHDIGYSAQMGIDPAFVTLKYASRIFEMHIKDITKDSIDGTDCEVGRGIIDFPSLIKAVRKSKYTGVCAMEFEKDPLDPLPGIAESIGYLRGVIKTTQQ